MQTVLVFVIVGLAAIWLGRRLFISLRPAKKDKGCDSCH